MRENSQEYSEMLVSELSLGLSFTVRLGANHEPPLLSVAPKLDPMKREISRLTRAFQPTRAPTNGHLKRECWQERGNGPLESRPPLGRARGHQQRARAGSV